MDISKIVQNIQYLLAPAVMVSSSALLLLGFQNKFSNLASRFRALNHEKRMLLARPSLDKPEESRLRSLSEQVEQLMRRASKVRNAIIYAYLAIVCFTGTSFLLFLNGCASLALWPWIIGIFLLGMFLVLGSALWMIWETELFYKVINLERKS